MLEHLSRESGLETAGRIHARAGFDSNRKRFVRILDRLVVSRATQGTASTVLSTGASWGEFLSATESEGPRAYASAHTHLHLGRNETKAGRAGENRPESMEASRSKQEPIISIDDVVTHYTAFPDPLSAALIVSLFPDRRVVTVYGYAVDARLVAEPGYRVLHDD